MIKHSPMGLMLATAADGGGFSFETVSYDQWIRFMKKHAPKLVIHFGKRDPAFENELRRLAEVADQEYRDKQPKNNEMAK